MLSSYPTLDPNTNIACIRCSHTRIRSPSMHTDILLFTAFCATYLLDTYKALSPPNKFCFILSFPCAYVAALPVNYTATQIHGADGTNSKFSGNIFMKAIQYKHQIIFRCTEITQRPPLRCEGVILCCAVDI